jgi:hypothetical protein
VISRVLHLRCRPSLLQGWLHRLAHRERRSSRYCRRWWCAPPWHNLLSQCEEAARGQPLLRRSHRGSPTALVLLRRRQVVVAVALAGVGCSLPGARQARVLRRALATGATRLRFRAAGTNNNARRLATTPRADQVKGGEAAVKGSRGVCPRQRLASRVRCRGGSTWIGSRRPHLTNF